ncbi:MAG: helix-turn-helix transcriptional regulator [Chitinispirillaceae bacterium]|nr:helix-turn-helix transcriptional regulator [Chitinispirillaceae bacterium]
MQAVVKAPHIDVTITGQGIENVIDGLKKMIAGVRIKYVKDDSDPWIDDPITMADEQDTVDPFSTAWYRNVAKNTTAGDRLNTERFKASMTQNRLSELMGIPQHHISEMENGKRYIGRNTARKLAKVFKTDYRYFL